MSVDPKWSFPAVELSPSEMHVFSSCLKALPAAPPGMPPASDGSGAEAGAVTWTESRWGRAGGQVGA